MWCSEMSTSDNGWRSTNLNSLEASIEYHYDQHGLAAGVTRSMYISDAVQWTQRQVLSDGVQVMLKDGTIGYRFRTPGGGPGGILDSSGKVITFWYD